MQVSSGNTALILKICPLIYYIEPLLEIAKILYKRGYSIEFATLQGQEKWADGYPFVSKIHILGPGVPADIEEANYMRMTDWEPLSLFGDCKPIFDARKFLGQSWPSMYSGLSALMKDSALRPDFILSDYLVDAVIDMKVEHNIPVAMHWPQMPTNMLPASYIPGIPGLQVDVLSSENASLWQRLKCELVGFRMIPELLRYLKWRRKMRSTMAVKRSLPSASKPDHLLLANTFFGLEIPKDIPPNVAAIGPIMTDKYPPLVEPVMSFVQNHKKIIYVAFGTHVLFQNETILRIMAGLSEVLHQGLVDGIIWPIRGMARKQLDLSANAPGYLSGKYTVGDLLNGRNPDMQFLDFAPQRAILAHQHTCAFVSHGGQASINEALFHAVPLVTISVYFDQLQNAMRLRDAGVSISLNKINFRPADLSAALTEILEDPTGGFGRNSLRMQKIARIASKRKHLAADLIEEVLADHEGRHVGSVCVRPMHLQTADMRMPTWKARNWDLQLLGAATFILSAAALGAAIFGVERGIAARLD